MSTYQNARLLSTSAAVLLLVGCGKPTTTTPARPVPTVTVFEVKTESVPIVRSFTSTLKALKTVQIVPEVTGHLQKR